MVGSINSPLPHPLFRLSGTLDRGRVEMNDSHGLFLVHFPSRLPKPGTRNSKFGDGKRTPFCEFVFLNTDAWHRLPFIPGTTFFAAWSTNKAGTRVFFQAGPRQFAAKVFHREGEGEERDPSSPKLTKKERFWTEGRSVSRLFSPLGENQKQWAAEKRKDRHAKAHHHILFPQKR